MLCKLKKKRLGSKTMKDINHKGHIFVTERKKYTNLKKQNKNNMTGIENNS